MIHRGWFNYNDDEDNAFGSSSYTKYFSGKQEHFNFQINSREPYNFSTDNINLSKNLFSSKLNNHNNLNFTNFINNNINYSNNGKNSIFVDNNEECNIKLIQTNKNNNNEL